MAEIENNKKSRSARPPADLKHLLPLFGSGGQATLGYRILLVGRLIDRALSQILKEKAGISVNTWRVMLQIGLIESCTVRSLADGAALDRAEVSRIIRDLTTRDWVERRVNEADSRSPLFYLSEEGLSVFKDLRKPTSELIKHLIDEIATEDVDATDKALWAITKRVIDV